MKTLLAILILVLAMVAWPILAGLLFFLFTGGPVLLLTLAWNVIGEGLTICMSKMLVVPFLGRLVRICISIFIGATLIGLVTIGIAVPLIFIAVMFVNGEASQPDVECDGWLVDFYCTHFKWLAHMCNCKYILAYTAGAESDDNILLLMNKAILESLPISAAVLTPWYTNIKILMWVLQNWCNDRD